MNADSAERARRAGEEARRRALRLADVAHLSDESEDEDVTEELAPAGRAPAAPLDPFGFSKK